MGQLVKFNVTGMLFNYEIYTFNYNYVEFNYRCRQRNGPKTHLGGPELKCWEL